MGMIGPRPCRPLSCLIDASATCEGLHPFFFASLSTSSESRRLTCNTSFCNLGNARRWGGKSSFFVGNSPVNAPLLKGAYTGILEAEWKYVDSILPTFPSSIYSIPPCIVRRSVLDVLIRVRKGLIVAQTILRPSELSKHQRKNADLIYRWWTTSIASDLGIVLNLALTLSSKMVSVSSTVEEEFERRLSAAIAPTMFCTIRKYMREATFETIDFQDAYQVLAPRLRVLVEAVLDGPPTVKLTKTSTRLSSGWFSLVHCLSRPIVDIAGRCWNMRSGLVDGWRFMHSV